MSKANEILGQISEIGHTSGPPLKTRPLPQPALGNSSPENLLRTVQKRVETCNQFIAEDPNSVTAGHYRSVLMALEGVIRDIKSEFGI